ncbi:signal peptidase [Bordetella genomosp. 10]|uniref:Signal peptidase n=2 Tax=Bordetella genomosp. 10 TaxID=1416804 RepID=A0A261SIL9_9BORD|nr:signal peptidase [Bordetella genomosp. 10]
MFVGVAASAATATAAQAATTLTMTTEYPATAMPGLGVSTFADLVKRKTHGEVIIEPSFDAAKGIKSAGMIDAVQARKVDAGDAFAGGLSNTYPIFGVSSLPFLADSLQKARALTKASRPAYEKLLAEHNQKLLYTTPWPASGIWSKTPIKSVADLKALSIRTYDDTSQATMTKAGAKASNISFADAMPRIAAGDVNAVLSSGDGGAGRKLWQYLPAFAEINYAMPISVATMNLDAYKALSPAERKAIDQAAAETEAEQWKRIQGRLKANYDNMRKNGVAIDTHVPGSVKKALKDAAADAVATWKQQTGADGAAILKRYQGK